MLQKKESAKNHGEAIIIMDIPLLFESKFTELVDKTLLVFVDEDIQLQRLMERNHYSKQEALARIHSQMPLAEKKRLADVVIDNNGSLEQTGLQLKNVLSEWGFQKEEA
jgi:dephospho-CoA kinase